MYNFLNFCKTYNLYKSKRVDNKDRHLMRVFEFNITLLRKPCDK